MQSDASDISPVIREKAPIILAEIKKAKSILLHCHPSPDPDSVGSALAMKFALEQLGKKAMVIRGDSEIPQAFDCLPGVFSIVPKEFKEVDLKDFDLFIILDTAAEIQISRHHTPVMPLPLRTVVIDHHFTNQGYADTNLVEPSAPATSQILYDLFVLWGIDIGHDIAANLFAGIYTDTGGFQYRSTTIRTFEIAAILAEDATDFSAIISRIQNGNTPEFLAFEGAALDAVETFYDGKLAVSVVPHKVFEDKKIPVSASDGGMVVELLRSVPAWKIVVLISEPEPGVIRLNARTLQSDEYDVSKLMSAFTGGGHKAAAGAKLSGVSAEEVKDKLVAKAKELYNL